MTKLYNNEASDEYVTIITQIDSRTRVIRRRHDLQWIMRKRSSPELNKGYWIGLSHDTKWDSATGPYPNIIECPCHNVSGGQED